MKSIKLVTVLSFTLLPAIIAALPGPGLLAQEGAPDPIPAYGSSESHAIRTVGVTVGLDRAYHDGGFRMVTVPTGRTFQSGEGWGFTAGASLQFGLSASSSVVARLTYASRPGNFQQTLTHASSIAPVYQGNMEVEDVRLQAVSDITYALASFEALYQLQLLRLGSALRLGAAAGPTFGYVLDGTIRQTETIIDPADARFDGRGGMAPSDDGRSVVLFDGDIPDRGTTRWSLKGGIVAEVAMPGSGWFVSPGVYYDYALTSVTSSESWNLNALTFQMDIRYAF